MGAYLQGDDDACEAQHRGNSVEDGTNLREDGSRKRQLSDEESELGDRVGLGMGMAGADT